MFPMRASTCRPPPASPSRRLERPTISMHPQASLALSRAHSLFPSLSLTHGRTPPSPPLAAAAATASPSTSLRTRELRHDVFYVLDEPGNWGRTVSPPPPSSSTPAAMNLHRPSVACRASPEPPFPLLDSP